MADHVMQTYKIINNIDIIYEKKLFKPCMEVRTRGHALNESTENSMQEPRQAHTFSQRMVNDWNALPDAVISSGNIIIIIILFYKA